MRTSNKESQGRLSEEVPFKLSYAELIGSLPGNKSEKSLGRGDSLYQGPKAEKREPLPVADRRPAWWKHASSKYEIQLMGQIRVKLSRAL